LRKNEKRRAVTDSVPQMKKTGREQRPVFCVPEKKNSRPMQYREFFSDGTQCLYTPENVSRRVCQVINEEVNYQTMRNTKMIIAL
jgi:hypothetical protein